MSNHVKITIIAEGPAGSGKSLAVSEMLRTFDDSAHFLNHTEDKRTIEGSRIELTTFYLQLRRQNNE